MADYPDGTMPVSIIGQTIDDLNVDIIAQTIGNIAVNIAAQTLATLGVNIKAQDLAQVAIDITAQTLTELAIKTIGTTKLAIDIAAQTLSTLGINITAQDLAELVIKINAQAVGIYLQPEWAAKQGIDKNISGIVTNVGNAVDTLVVDYLVPANKTLYVTDYGFHAEAGGAGGANVYCYLFDWIGAGIISINGGAQGCYASLSKPAIVPGGRRARLYGAHYSTANSNLHGIIIGYEI